MNRIFSFIGIGILALGFFVLIVRFSVYFGVSEKHDVEKKTGIRYSLLRLPAKDDDTTTKFEVIPFEVGSLVPEKNKPILAEFGRLGSFLYLSSESKEKPLEEK